MPVDKFKPAFVSESESKEFATRQILSFLSLTEEESKKRAPSKALFSLSKIPKEAITEKPPFFKWKSRPIYDVDGVLLFWDQSIELDDGASTLTVRTAGSDLLRTPVWSVRAGEKRHFDHLISEARSALNDSPALEPVQVHPEKLPRLICYSYPKLGILAVSRTQPGLRFVVDLSSRRLIPADNNEHEETKPREEWVNTIWSPYDLVTRATVDYFRALWRRNRGSLLPMPGTPEQITRAVADEMNVVEEITTYPDLDPKVGQETEFYCAPATMAMILRHHGVVQTQFDIATKMETTDDGTFLGKQVDAVDDLTGNAFVGTLDLTTSFAEGKDEIRANRPFKTGGIAHARACCGFMIEGSGKEWLYIYDPLPEFRGDVYFESWEADYQCDYIYVRRAESE